MKDISDAADLMATAREALLSELLPALPTDRRYAGLMIANVMAIAAREHRLGADAARAEAARLRNLLDDIGFPFVPATNAITSAELPSLRTLVCATIRAGRFDDGSHASALAAQLLQTAADWVAISNPKALRA